MRIRPIPRASTTTGTAWLASRVSRHQTDGTERRPRPRALFASNPRSLQIGALVGRVRGERCELGEKVVARAVEPASGSDVGGAGRPIPPAPSAAWLGHPPGTLAFVVFVMLA